jgi:hypothetical protein
MPIHDEGFIFPDSKKQTSHMNFKELTFLFKNKKKQRKATALLIQKSF